MKFANCAEIYFRWRQRIKLEWHGNFWAHDPGPAEADQPPGRRSDLEITEIAEKRNSETEDRKGKKVTSDR